MTSFIEIWPMTTKTPCCERVKATPKMLRTAFQPCKLRFEESVKSVNRYIYLLLLVLKHWEPKNPITGELHIKRHSDFFSGANNLLTEVLPVPRTHRKTFQGDYWLQWASNQHEGSQHPLI